MESLERTKNFVLEHFKDKNKERLEHILGVVEMARYLAKLENVDVTKACIAAYMHDYCKYDSIEDIEKYLSDEEKEECKKYPFLYHAYGSAYTYKKFIGNDDEIFNAIYHHVFGRPKMSKLEEIIMISDYTEKNRRYESCVACREILLSGKLNEAILYSLEKTIEHVKLKKEIPHPRQIEVYKEYLKKVGNTMTLEETLLEDLAKVKAKNILVYDMKEKSPFYDKMILCSVDSQRQATAVISYIKEDVEKNGFKLRSVEGAASTWVLIDCYDIIVSIFTKEEREHFALEKIYMDVPVKQVEDK